MEGTTKYLERRKYRLKDDTQAQKELQVQPLVK